MFIEKDAAFDYALELVEKALQNPAVSVHLNAESANEIADFVETFADRLTDKD